MAALAEERGSRVSVLSGRLHSLRAEADVAAAEARRCRAELMAAQTHCHRLAGELATAKARGAALEAGGEEAREGLSALQRSVAAGGGETALYAAPPLRPASGAADAAAAAATARVAQLEREVATLQQSSATYVRTLAAAERNLGEMSELLAAGEQARQRCGLGERGPPRVVHRFHVYRAARRLQQQLDEAAANAGAASHMSAAQIALQRRESEAAEKTQRQLHAATDAVTALKVCLPWGALSSACWFHSPVPYAGTRGGADRGGRVAGGAAPGR